MLEPEQGLPQLDASELSRKIREIMGTKTQLDQSIQRVADSSNAFREELRNKLRGIQESLSNLLNGDQFRTLITARQEAVRRMEELNEAKARIAELQQNMAAKNQEIAAAQARQAAAERQRNQLQQQMATKEAELRRQLEQEANDYRISMDTYQARSQQEKDELTRQFEEQKRQAQEQHETQMRSLQQEKDGAEAAIRLATNRVAELTLAQADAVEELGDVQNFLADALRKLAEIADAQNAQDIKDQIAGIERSIADVVSRINEQGTLPSMAGGAKRRTNRRRTNRRRTNRRRTNRRQINKRRGTRKHRSTHRKRHFKGGYVYGAESAELKKGSSVVSGIDSSSSSSSKKKKKSSKH